MSDFAKALKALRKERHLSQRELAEMMGVDRTSVSNWERGARIPNMTMAQRLANTLGVEVQTVFGTVEQPFGRPMVVLVDDDKEALADGMTVLEDLLPEGSLVGFDAPTEAMGFIEDHPTSLVFLQKPLTGEEALDKLRSLRYKE